MKTTTLWFSHPNQDKSIVNKMILEKITCSNLVLNIRNLDQLYLDFNIDVPIEQNILRQTDRIILLFPIYWLGMPSLLTHWREKVFLKDFAYTDPFSNKASELKDKELIVIMTLGAPESAYSKDAFIQEEFSQYTKWIEAMAHFTEMKLQKIYPFFRANITDKQDILVLNKRIDDFVKEICDNLKTYK